MGRMWVALAGICLAHQVAGGNGIGNCTTSAVFDFMYFVQFWSPTQCKLYDCTVKSPEFSVHGE